jgi:hypothetical protein
MLAAVGMMLVTHGRYGPTEEGLTLEIRKFEM